MILLLLQLFLAFAANSSSRLTAAASSSAVAGFTFLPSSSLSSLSPVSTSTSTSTPTSTTTTNVNDNVNTAASIIQKGTVNVNANRVSFMRRFSSNSDNSDNSDNNDIISKAPSFNGQMVFPMKVFMNGLKGHKVAAVFCIFNNQYKRGQQGWENAQHISITKDLYAEIQNLQSQYGTDQIAHVRALSFVYPQKSAMEEVANRWKAIVDTEHGGIVPWKEYNSNDSDSDNDSAVGVVGNDNNNNDNDNDIQKEDEMTDKEKIIQLIKDTAFYDDDDDDDDEFDDDDEYYEMLSSTKVKKTIDDAKSTSNDNDEEGNNEATIVSPFETTAKDDDNEDVVDPSSSAPAPTLLTDDDGKLIFNEENVSKVLDEIRPYLISDGGNVSVQRIDVETRSVYLKLEGACGSCASSTVTMSMGIQRVLKENFDDLGEVVQVEDDDTIDGSGNGGEGGNSKDLTMEAVVAELNRIGPAISAMGGNVEVVSVDPIGVVELRFRGSTKIQQGLELAIRDVPLVKHVKFVN